MYYIRRSLESVVSNVTQEYPVVLLTGPRQAERTTMLKKLRIRFPRRPDGARFGKERP